MKTQKTIEGCFQFSCWRFVTLFAIILCSQVTGYGQTNPDLVPQNIGFSPATVTAGGSFTISYRIRNLGPGNASVGTTARMRLSLDSNLTSSDPPLSPLDQSIPALPSGQFHDVSRSVTVPAGTPAGQYYVGVFADAADNLTQPTGNDGGVSSARITVNAVVQDPDLIPENIGFSPASVTAGGSFTVGQGASGIRACSPSQTGFHRHPAGQALRHQADAHP